MPDTHALSYIIANATDAALLSFAAMMITPLIAFAGFAIKLAINLITEVKAIRETCTRQTGLTENLTTHLENHSERLEELHKAHEETRQEVRGFYATVALSAVLDNRVGAAEHTMDIVKKNVEQHMMIIPLMDNRLTRLETIKEVST